MDARAASNVAVKGLGCAMPELFTIKISRWTAWLIVSTATATRFVLVAKPSLTMRSIGCVPAGKTSTATTPVANEFSELDSSHRYCSRSPSGSHERVPLRITVALVPLDEMTTGCVALASATGGRLTCNRALELIAKPYALVTLTE